MATFFLYPFLIRGELRAVNFKPFRIQFIKDGWSHLGDLSFIDDADIKLSLCRSFSFRHEVQEKVSNAFGQFDGLTFGLHIRRGDYREWIDGRYYYSDSSWVKWMHDIKEHIAAAGERCRFMIASNEPWTYTEDGLDIIHVPDADGMADLCALSRCDYILGPPSTFSQWASFVGNVPLHIVISPDQDVDMNAFSPVVRIGVFENGTRLQWNSEENRFIVA